MSRAIAAFIACLVFVSLPLRCGADKTNLRADGAAFVENGLDSITDPIPDPTCKKGVASPDLKVCCTDECGSCGTHSLCDDIGKYHEITGKLADNCCRDRILKKAQACDKNHPPCVLSDDYAKSLDEYKFERPKRHAMDDCNKAPDMARFKHALGIEKGEFFARMYLSGRAKYDDALELAVRVHRLCERQIKRKEDDKERLEDKISSAIEEDKVKDTLTGASPYMNWEDDLESDKSEIRFYKMIVSNSKEVQGLAKAGIKKVAELKREVQPKKNVEKDQLKLNMLIEDANQVYRDAELLWQQWLDSSKDYSCHAPPAVEHAASMCKAGNTKYKPKCSVQCEVGYDDPDSKNALRCLKQGKFGKQLYGEWQGMATCHGRNCGLPPKIHKAHTVAQEIRYPHRAHYHCYEGYSIDGNVKSAKGFAVTCGDTGNYERNVSHVCKKVKCGPAPPAKHTQPVKGIFHYTDVITYKCLTGYTLDETPGGHTSYTVSCQANAQFTSAQECRRVRCGPPPDFANTKDPPKQFDRYFGDELSFACRPGYSLDQMPGGPKKFTLVCGAKGEFHLVGGKGTAVSLPKCRPVSAGKTPKIDHGNLPTTEMFYGDHKLVSADVGYSITRKAGEDTSFELSVTEDGKLSGLKNFEAVSCGPPPMVKHSQANFDKEEAVFGDVLPYKCDSGYSTDLTPLDSSASFSVTCEADGDFSKIPGTGTCGNIDDCAQHTCGPHGSCVDLLNDYKCECDRGFKQTVDEDSGEKVCGNINDCGPEACGVGKCIDLVMDYKCECPTGYEQTGEDKEKTCTAKVCGTPPEVDNAKTSPLEDAVAKASYQKQITYQCATGHTLSGKAGGQNHFVIYCNADRSFTDTKACKPIECGAVPKIEKAKESASEAFYNKSIKYRCEKGYTIDGTNEGDDHFSITCLVTGTYSEAHECKPVTCGEPDDIANSHRESGQVYFPQKRKYTCFEGFTLTGIVDTKADFEIECQNDGSLTKTKECLPVVCGEPKKFLNVLYATTADEGPVAYPRVTEVTCRDGYTVGGDPKGKTVFGVQCTKYGKFEKYDERECMPVRCGAPPKFPDATLAKVETPEPAKAGFREEVFYMKTSDGVGDWCKFPDLTHKKPSTTRVVSTVNYHSGAKWSGLEKKDYFVVRWLGALHIEEAGKYDFSIESDDGSKFILNGILTINNGGCHGMQKRSGSQDLVEGPQAVHLEMFEKGGAAGMIFKYKGPDTDNKEVVVSQSAMQSKGANLNFEEKATYECRPGFTAGGEADAPTTFHVECLANGHVSYPPPDMQCRNVNACEHHTCGARGTCVDVVGTSTDAYNCKCEFGFEQQVLRGEKHCGNIDDCGKHECGPGTCKDLIGDYTCVCPSGHYVGMDGGEKTCLPVRCAPAAPSLENGKMLTKHTGPVDFPLSLRFGCDKGYSIDGSVAEAKRTFHAHCKPDGSLYGMMSCQKISCGTARVLLYTTLVNPGHRNSIDYKEKASYQCEEGYTVGGTAGGKTKFEVGCQDNGILTDPLVCEPVKCGLAPSYPKAKPGIAGDVFYGMHLEYQCDSGYTLDGTLTGGIMFSQDCQKDGKFGPVEEVSGILMLQGDGSDPMARSADLCKPISAGVLPEIPNAELAEYNGAKPTSSSVTAYYPDGFEYHCKPNHTLNGGPTGHTKFTSRVNAFGMFVPVLPTKCLPITYSAMGIVKDSRTGRPMTGCVVKLAGTSPAIQARSQAGYFALRSVRPGTYTVQYRAQGAIDVDRRVSIVDNIPVGSVMDISMSPKMADDQWRVVLKWNRQPLDLDSYAKWGFSKVCWYGRNQWGGNMVGKLEKDDTDGYGPETVFLSRVGKCTGSSSACDIKYLVNDYTESGKMYDISGATVTLYSGSRVAGSWKIKDCKSSVTNNQYWWHVFTIDGRSNKLKWECTQPPVPPIVPGLREDVFYFDQGHSLPILNGRIPDMSRTVYEVNYGSTSGTWSGLTKRDNFAIRWEGSIRINTGGAYTFFLTSDDGSKFWVGEILIVNNDGLHGMSEKSGKGDLDAKLQGVRLDYFEKGGGAGCIFKYSGPDSSNRKVVVKTALRTKPVLRGVEEEVFYFDKELTTLPNLNGLKPNEARQVATVNYGVTEDKWPGFARSDRFAVRWTGYVNVRTPGHYTFYITSDDGSKLWISDKQLVDNGGLHGMIEKSGSKTLTTGPHTMRFEMYDAGGGAGAIFKYKGPDSNNQKVVVPETALRKRAGEPPVIDVDAGLFEEVFYFEQGSKVPILTGRNADKTRTVPFVNYRSTGGIWPGLRQRDHFAVRWTGSILIRIGGSYKLSLTSDDGSMMWMDRTLVVDNDGLHGMRNEVGTADLGARAHAIRIQYFEKTGGGGCIFQYSGPQTRNQFKVVPERFLLKTSSIGGLLEEAFFFDQGSKIPSLNGRLPNLARKVENVNYRSGSTKWAGFPRSENFVARWTGALLINRAGSYAFYISSDDGSRMFFENQLLVDNDGLHGTQEKSGTKHITTEGQQHIRLEFFQAGGGLAMMFKYKGPDTGNAKQVATSFRMPAGMPTVVPMLPPDAGLSLVDESTPTLAGDNQARNASHILADFNAKANGSWIDAASSDNISKLPAHAEGQDRNLTKSTFQAFDSMPVNRKVLLRLHSAL